MNNATAPRISAAESTAASIPDTSSSHIISGPDTIRPASERRRPMFEKFMLVIFLILSLLLALFTGAVLAICIAAAVMDAIGDHQD